MTAARFDAVDELTSVSALGGILDNVGRVETVPFMSGGFSGSSLHWVRVSSDSEPQRRFVLKRTRLSTDWFSQRTADPVGREAAMLGEPALAEVWESFACPYVAYAIERDEIGILMRDLSDSLFPDERKPINRAHEDLVVDTMAGMHAHYWQSGRLDMPWLLRTPHYLDMMGPGERDQDRVAPPPSGIREAMREGWEAALSRLPSSIAELVMCPAEELAQPWHELPTTLVHGDLKIANLAVLSGGRVAAVDWAFIGVAPCTIEVGWYLAVNASRMTRTKEDFIDHYRGRLQAGIGRAIDEALWARMVLAGLLGGAMMLLWAKGGAVQAGRDGAQREWDWWLAQLGHVRDAIM